MDYQLSETGFVKANEVMVPSIYFRRMMTNVKTLDDFFQGMVPGSTYTVAGPAGTGKTTFLLQVLEFLEKAGYSTGYASCEEYLYQLAYTCHRLNVERVSIANMDKAEQIAEAMEGVDVLVVDSFSAVKSEQEDLKGIALERYKIDLLCRVAKEKECTVFFVLHYTKGGKYKGSTDLIHAVDGVITLGINEESPEYRTLSFDKYRFGSRAEFDLCFGAHGYDFETPVEIPTESKAVSKKGSWAVDKENILQMNEPPHITVTRICTELNMEAWKANNLLRQLVQEGKLIKYGRGDDAVWKLSNP